MLAEIEKTLLHQSQMLDVAIKNLQHLSEIQRLDGYMTVEEAAAYARVSTQTIHKHKTTIGYSRPDRKVIIKKSDLIAWIENFRTQKIH